MFKLCALVSVASTAAAAPAFAATMWVHDSTNNLAKVDTETGVVSLIGRMTQTMTDIAFDPLGNLFGITFSSFYSINTTDASTRFIGNTGQSDLNALVFGVDNTLYSMGNLSTNLYALDVGTGAATSLGSTGFRSGGDLAFVGDAFYLASSGSQLVRIDIANPSNSVAVGPFGISGVFGIASTGAGDLFGVAGTSIFKVNTVTGAAFDVRSYAGQGLGAAFGQSFITEAGAPDPEVPAPIPVPASLWLLGSALAAAGALRRKRASPVYASGRA